MKANGRMELNSNGVDWGNVWHYRTFHPIEVVESEGYFTPLQNHIGQKDEIKVCVDFSDGGWAKALFEVLWSEKDCVVVQRVGDWRTHGMAIDGPLEVVARGDDRFDVVETRTKRTIRKGLARLEAQMWASRGQEKPVDDMSIPELQKKMKELTGAGFPPGKFNIDEMREQVKAA